MRAKKSLGQNFLRDEAIIGKIVDVLDLTADDVVIEIGPGQGALTEELLKRAGRVIAVEFDRDMIAVLRERFGRSNNFDLVDADILDVDLAGLAAGNTTKVVGNLPYNISTPILQKLIDCRKLFTLLVLMFQREVVERITALPGGRERGFLSVLVENAFEAERLFDVPPTAFAPVPKVWSSVVRLTPVPSRVRDEFLLRDLVSISFAQKRKTLLNNLKTRLRDAGSVLSDCGIDGGRRAETLALGEWARLADAIKKTGHPTTSG